MWPLPGAGRDAQPLVSGGQPVRLYNVDNTAGSSASAPTCTLHCARDPALGARVFVSADRRYWRRRSEADMMRCFSPPPPPPALIRSGPDPRNRGAILRIFSCDVSGRHPPPTSLKAAGRILPDSGEPRVHIGGGRSMNSNIARHGAMTASSVCVLAMLAVPVGAGPQAAAPAPGTQDTLLDEGQQLSSVRATTRRRS